MKRISCYKFPSTNKITSSAKKGKRSKFPRLVCIGNKTNNISWFLLDYHGMMLLSLFTWNLIKQKWTLNTTQIIFWKGWFQLGWKCILTTIIISCRMELVHILQNYARTLSKQYFTVDTSIRTNGHPNLRILTFWIIIFQMKYRSVFKMV